VEVSIKENTFGRMIVAANLLFDSLTIWEHLKVAGGRLLKKDVRKAVSAVLSQQPEKNCERFG